MSKLISPESLVGKLYPSTRIELDEFGKQVNSSTIYMRILAAYHLDDSSGFAIKIIEGENAPLKIISHGFAKRELLSEVSDV